MTDHADHPGDAAVDPVAALTALVRIPTVSDRDPARMDVGAFEVFGAELAARFPRVHGLETVRVGGHGLLVHWPGASSERPVVLMAHLDVVPVDPTSPWTHPAFGGEVHEGYLWGRGTLDDKGALVAAAGAVETLLARGHVPAQDVWLSFGCDEEVSGSAAREAVAELGRRGVRPWFVLDEGGAVATQALPGIDVPLAVVGVAEKGVMSLVLRAEGRGGHASTPARGGPTARVARAVVRLDRLRMPARTPDATLAMFTRVASVAPRPLRPLLRRADRLRPLVTRALVAAGPETAAMTRTTLTVTTLTGSPALNVVASVASAGLNVRVMVGEGLEEVLARITEAVDDGQVAVEVVEASAPSPLSPVDDDAFRLLEATTAAVFPDALTVPYVMMAATDSRYFTDLCPRVYRFAPLRMSKAQRAAIHSFDEHVGVDDLRDALTWYVRLIESLPAAGRSREAGQA